MKSVKLVGLVGMLAGLCSYSQATILAPGGLVSTPVEAPGTSVLDTLVTPFAFGGLSGTITSWVVSDPANPLGGLSFYYQVTEVGPESVSRVSVSDFGLNPGSPVDVAAVTSTFDSSVTGGVLPFLATRSSTGGGSTVGFLFVGNQELLPGQSSAVLVVNTSYTAFQVTAGSVIDSSSVNVAILGPVPEPSNVMAAGLLLLPLCASALRIVRKR